MLNAKKLILFLCSYYYRLNQVKMYNIFLVRIFYMESEQENQSQDVFEGRWLKDEHDRFLVGIIQHGKDWKIVEKVVKTRTGSQVRSHAQKFFIKLNKINKERKKCKNHNLIQPSDIQKEILDHFTEQDITTNTPLQITAVIRKDWNAVAVSFKQKKRQSKNSKPGQLSSKKNPSESESQRKEKEENSNNSKNSQPQNNQDSYFIRIIKMNKQLFIKGHDFKELIDFGQIGANFGEESQTNLGLDKQRKRSFGLPDDEQNESKLKETLENLHKKMERRQ